MLLFFLHFFSCIKSNFDMWHIYNIDLRYITIGQLPHPLIGSSANHKKKRDTLFFFFIFFASVFLNHAINKFIEKTFSYNIRCNFFLFVKSVELFLQLDFSKCIDRIYIYIYSVLFFSWCLQPKMTNLFMMFPLYVYLCSIYIYNLYSYFFIVPAVSVLLIVKTQKRK